MKRLGLDLDGTLYPWHRALYIELLIHDKTHLEYDEFWEHGYKIYNRLWWENMCKVEFLYSSIPPSKLLLDMVNRLSSKYELYYITSRPKELYTTTKTYLYKYKFPYIENVYLTPDKRPFVMYYDIDIMVDDKPDVLDKLACTRILVTQPWNKDKEVSYKRINNILDLEKEL